MPRFDPFRALRYAPGSDLDAVIAPPYDVLSQAQVESLQVGHEHNITHVDVPVGGADRYVEAGRRLRDWIDQGILVADQRPSFTVYRMRFTDETGVRRDLAGVFGALEVVDADAGGVLPHERTTAKASSDRLELTRATACNMSPVWGLALARGLTDELREPGEPLGSLTVDGVEHVVERIDDPDRIARIKAAVCTDDVLIADGHHRYGVARTYLDEQLGTSLGTAAELTLAFVGELTPEQLSIQAIHRLYDGIDVDTLRVELSTCFDVAPAPRPEGELLSKMRQRGALALLAPGGTAQYLIPKPRAFEGVRSLDGAWLEHALVNSAATVSYQHGVDEVLHALDTGAAQAAVLIRPVSITEIERTAREGLLMPPKSTFFIPKLRTGLVIRDLTQP